MVLARTNAEPDNEEEARAARQAEEDEIKVAVVDLALGRVVHRLDRGGDPRKDCVYTIGGGGPVHHR